MRPLDVKILLEEIQNRDRRKARIVWTEEQRAVIGRAKVAVFHGRWLDAKDAWILEAMYRRTQGGLI